MRAPKTPPTISATRHRAKQLVFRKSVFRKPVFHKLALRRSSDSPARSKTTRSTLPRPNKNRHEPTKAREVLRHRSRSSPDSATPAPPRTTSPTTSRPRDSNAAPSPRSRSANPTPLAPLLVASHITPQPSTSASEKSPAASGAPRYMAIRSHRSERGSKRVAPNNASLQRNKSTG